MDEKYKPSRRLVVLLAFLGLVGSSVSLVLMLTIGVALSVFAWGEFDADQDYVMHFKLDVMSAICGLAFAVFVYRAARHRVSWPVIFHACFLFGLTLLAYCLWAVLSLISLLSSPSMPDFWVVCILPVTASVPVFCFLVIPIAFFFLAFAVIQDNNRNAYRHSRRTSDAGSAPQL